MVKVARAAETVCADSINTPPLGKRIFSPGRIGIFAKNDRGVRLMRAVTAILLFMSGVTAGAETAETIFINGNIYTVNSKQPSAQAIAVKGGRIIFVG